MKYTYKKVAEMALDEAERKLKLDKLIKNDDLPDDGDFPIDWFDHNGDPETLCSIALMYADAIDENLNVDMAYDIILDALIEKYPEYM
jgi:hypothetical protein